MKSNLQKAAYFLWENRESYREKISKQDERYYFDSEDNTILPRYGGLPAEISNELTMTEIDAIGDLWSDLIRYDGFCGCAMVGFKNKREYYSAIKKKIRERIAFQKEREPVSLGDFFAWAIKNNWWIRGFESVCRSHNFKDGVKNEGWSFTWTTQCGFVSDQDIRKQIKPKTAKQWECWGR